MLFKPKDENRLDWLTDELQLARAPTFELMSQVISNACTRLPALHKTKNGVRFDQMVRAGAWSDAALALIQLELPAWKLRRLVFDDGKWFCSLSKQLNLPIEIDDTADSNHDVMSLAILSAFLEARRRSSPARQALSTVPRVGSSADEAVFCDDFS